MRFIFFTDIHLCEGTGSRDGMARCLESMLAHEPALLINGGDMGVAPDALAAYDDLTRGIGVPIHLCLGNHEMCSGRVPRYRNPPHNVSLDSGGVHFVILDLCRYYPPDDGHVWNWYVVADEPTLTWLRDDLRDVSTDTPLVVVSHAPLSTSLAVRLGIPRGMPYPTNEVENAGAVLDELERFAHVAALHGHDHENCRHDVRNVHIMTTAAVAGNWWRHGLHSPAHAGEPQGYRIVDVSDTGRITSRYVSIVPEQDRAAGVFVQAETGQMLVNVFDASPRTRVSVDDVGPLTAIDADTCPPHMYTLPDTFDRRRFTVCVEFEDGRTERVELARRTSP